MADLLSIFGACPAAWRRRLAPLAVALFAASAPPAYGQTDSLTGDAPSVLITADDISADKELGIIVARGGVEIAYGTRVLMADTVSVNQKAKTVSANGNVTLLEPSGEVIFADYMELSDDLRDGVIERLRMLLQENARVAANGARRYDGNTTVFAKAVYSPCKVCEDDPDKDPLWQVKAKRIVHDQEDRRVEYYDAYLEFYGVPVAYTPYLTHPDPRVKRETGFLAPDYGTDTNVGTFIRVPFYWAIDRDKDATIVPIYTRTDGLVYSGEYRQRFNSGEITLSGSGSIADRDIGSPNFIETREDQFRGHVFAEGQFDINDQWRTGFDIERATDQTYLRRSPFFFDPGNAAESTVYVEGFNQRNYLSAKGHAFQDLRLGQRADSPLVLPIAEYQGFGETDSIGGRWELDSSFRSLTREDKSDNQRVSVEGGYRLPLKSGFGSITTFGAFLRGDAYYTDHHIQRDAFGNRVEDGVETRVVPQLTADWRLPFARYGESGTTLIEPMAAIYVSPQGGNDPNIANDDSLVVDLDSTSIFSRQRTPGLDRVEGGQRAVYGLRASHDFTYGGSVSGFLGQTYKFNKDQQLAAETALDDGVSDFVGNLDINPTKYLDVFYRFRVEEDNLRANRSEVGYSLGTSALGMSGEYVFVREGIAVDTFSIEELRLSAFAKWDDNWSIHGSTLRDLEQPNDGGSLKHSALIRYEDECFIFDSTFTRSFTRSTDIQSSDEFLVRLTFKTLAEFETQAF